MLFVELAKLADEPVEPLTIALRAPGQSALTAELHRPGREPVTVPLEVGGGAVTIGPIGMVDYASLVIRGWRG